MATKRLRSMHRVCITAFVGILLVCTAWSVWLICLTLAPNATVNRVLDTAALDSGLFWLFVDPPAATLRLGTTGLGCVVVGHLGTVWYLIGYRQQHVDASASSVVAVQPVSHTQTKTGPSEINSVAAHRWQDDTISALLPYRQSRARRLTAVAMKIGDLALQTTVLFQLMGSGFSTALLILFAASIACNAVSTAVFLSVPHTRMGNVHVVVDFAFDLFVAVLFPMIVLTTAFWTFTLDRGLMKINLNVFPLGSFEHAASVIADPVEVAVVRHFIDSLRIDSVAKAFTRVGTNVALWYQGFKVARLLRQQSIEAQPNVYPRYRTLGILFVAFAIGLVAFTERSITTSTMACVSHPECVQIARHWIYNFKVGDLTRCPCLAVIDRDITVARYDDWLHPPNRTEKISQLATSGYLQTLQLVNRELSVLPEQLRRCTNLKYVSLYYTGLRTLPNWFQEFTKLEFLHIEGQGTLRCLTALPDGVFDKMQSLAFIHLGSHDIPQFPSLSNLVRLKSITLAALKKLTTLPSFEALVNLEEMVLNSMVNLATTPNLDNIHKLKTFITFDRGAFCCNGFLGPGRCNLSHSFCKMHPVFKTPAVAQCLPATQQASMATRAAFGHFNHTTCFGEALRPGERKTQPTLAEMMQCNGTMYRACKVPGAMASGMCYNARWMGVACDTTPFAREMRRQQIAQRRGTPCDPVHEAWLGCVSK